MTIKVTYNVTDVYMSQSVSPVYINVSYSDGGQGIAVWGGITGTLSNQTDLQNALNLKVPYTGATTNVNLGEYELKAGQVTLDTSPTGTAAVGTIRWNDTTGTSETTLKGGNVIIKNGVDLVARVVNKVSPNTTLTKAAYQAVRVSGAQGQRLAIELAQANNDAGSADTIGLVTETIAPNQEGFIMTVGQLEGINTTGSLQGETWVDGDVLYLSPTTAGAITNVKPTGATGHLVIIGYVEYAHANNGKLYIKVMNGFELAELHDTSIVTPTNNQGLFYNSSNSLWENKTIATVLGYTPEQPLTFNSPLSRAGNVVSIPQATGSVNGFLSATDWTTFNSKQAALGFTPANAATTLTINGVTFDLSTSRTWNISTGISGSGAAGQVTYWTGASAVSGSNNLFWDNTNSRLGIGTNVPAFNLSIKSSTSVSTIHNQNNSTGGQYFITAGADSSYITGGASFNGTNWVAQATNAVLFGTFAGDVRIYANKSLTSGNIFTPSERFTIFGSTGNVAVNSTTDLSVRFGVVGDTLLRGSGNTSATSALAVQNSDSNNLMAFVNSGSFLFGQNAQRGYISITDSITTLGLQTLTIQNSLTISNTRATSAALVNGSLFITRDGIETSTVSSTTNLLIVGHRPSEGFAPTSGTALFTAQRIAPTINQTGGANGITRGLYVNPTLTSAADWRSVEWSNNSGWGLYGAGTVNNYLAGRLGIGTTALAAVNLAVYRNITGSAFSVSISSQGLVQSDVTNTAFGYYAATGTQATTFTLPALVQYQSDEGSFGAGSTITDHVGFRASNITSANVTNAYAFQGGMASGTNRWNLYMIGTANNYLAGNLGIGITPTVRLHVSGDTILRGSGATSATTALTVQNSSSTNLFRVLNDGKINFSNTGMPANTSIFVNIANGYVNYGSSYSNAPFFTYQAYGSWESIGADSSTGTILAIGGYRASQWSGITLHANGNEVMRVKQNGQVRFVPLSSAPASPQAGDVYYDSTINKLRVYTTAWETITSV